MLDKVAVVCPNIGIVYSGMGPDFRILITKARKSAQEYWKVYGEYPPTRVLTQEIANVMQQATQSGYVTVGCFSWVRVDLRLQWRPTVWGVLTCRRMGQQSRSVPVSSRSIWVFLGVEGQRNRQEYGQRENIPREAVRFPSHL